jgi:hypothetical protein
VSLGEKLIQAGMLTQQQWDEATRTVLVEGGFVGAVLVERGFVTADALGRFLEDAFSIPTLDSGPITPDPGVFNLAPAAFWRELPAVPLGRAEGVLKVAVARPLDVHVLDRLKRELGVAVRPVFAGPDDLMQALTPPEEARPPAEVPENSPTVEADRTAEDDEQEPPGPPAAATAEDTEDAGPAPHTLAHQVGWLEGGATEASVGAGAATALQASQPNEYEEWDVSEDLQEVFALIDDQPGWVAVVGEAEDRTAYLRALRKALEERGHSVIYFSAAERPYGELEFMDQASRPVLMVEDLNELEGHVPEQALLLQEVRKAHARGFGLVVGAGEPPSRLRALEPGLRVAVSLARVFPVGRQVPAWLGPIVREAAELLVNAGSEGEAERLHECLRSGDPSAAVSSAIEACKSLIGSC